MEQNNDPERRMEFYDRICLCTPSEELDNLRKTLCILCCGTGSEELSAEGHPCLYASYFFEQPSEDELDFDRIVFRETIWSEGDCCGTIDTCFYEEDLYDAFQVESYEGFKTYMMQHFCYTQGIDAFLMECTRRGVSLILEDEDDTPDSEP